MKIGFFGNTNNYPFMLAQAMRELGHEVVFIVNSTDLLNRPESRCPELRAGYPEWIVDGSEVSEWNYITLNPDIAPLLDRLSACDALMLNNLGPSLLSVLCRPAIALLTGSDLYYYANFETVETRVATWSSAYRLSVEGQINLNLLQDFVQRQRNGIRECVAVSIMPPGLIPIHDILLADIGIPDSQRFFIQMAELEQVKPTPPPDNQPMRVFCATRLTWKLPIEPGHSPLDYKGSDIMIKGLGLFYRQTGTRLNIRLPRKGLHVAETKQLIAEEGLIDQVTWLEEMPLTQVWEEFAQCDIAFEQLADSIIGMVGLDAMAASRPVIGNTQSSLVGSDSPICQAKTPEEVCAHLQQLVFNAAERERLGVAGRQYVEEHFSPARAAQICLERLQAALSANRAKTEWSGAGHTYYLQKRYDNMMALQNTQIQLQTIQTQLQATQANLQTTQAELQDTQTQLQAAQAQLQAAQTQLQAAQAQLQAAQTELLPYQSSRMIQLTRKLVQKKNALLRDNDDLASNIVS